ncbi:MAG: helix-turn-helix domain containing protein [Parvibaculaceae bacterium]|nr:helix-turn-helix domain containing protein [Parvibaculaceae bacterium]HBM89095.1 TetR/AcrR family transcriptional regulator [Rhodobiaceae bacterium]
MPRKQATTLSEIAEAALDHISRHGFKQTQMSDIAKAIGISAGTLYLYVENKEALLALASKFLLDPADLETSPLPFKAVSRDELATLFSETATKLARWPLLEQAIEDKTSDPDRFKSVGYEMFDLLSANRRAIWFLDRLAFELPEFAPVQLTSVRGRTLGLLTDLLEATGKSSIPPHGLSVMARAAIETLAWSAMHRHREGLDAQPMDKLSEEFIRDLAAQAFSGTLQAALK